MYAKDCAIRPGQTVTIQVSNKPYVDLSVPPESNDYRWADSATIEIWSTEPSEELLASDDMTPITGKPGWYIYYFPTTETMVKGIYRVVVRLSTSTGTGTSGTTGTTGTSGNPGTDLTDVKVSYFTIMDLY